MIDQIAERLRDAYATGPIAPPRDGLEPRDAAGAYAVQALNTAYWRSAGRRVVGRKIGLTAQAVRDQMGVSEPDFGVLFDDMRIADGGTLAASTVLQPKVEGEIAFVLRADLSDPDVDPQTVAAAVANVAAAIEIVDSRIVDWKISLADTIADNGSAGRFVLGPDAVALDDIDLAACAMTLRLNGEIASNGLGAASMGHPLNALTWLARTLASRGDGLRCGDVVLSGSLGPMIAVNAGDRVEVSISGLGRAAFTLS